MMWSIPARPRYEPRVEPAGPPPMMMTEVSYAGVRASPPAAIPRISEVLEDAEIAGAAGLLRARTPALRSVSGGQGTARPTGFGGGGSAISVPDWPAR